MSDWMLKELKLRFDEACEIVEQQQQRIAELEQQITRYREVIAEQASISAEHDVRMYAAEEQLSRYRSKYNNLLAVAHRDGGQYLAQHGEDAAGEDAITAILTAYHNNDCYQGAVEVEVLCEQYLRAYGNGEYVEAASIVLPDECDKFIGQRVKVIIIKEVESDTNTNPSGL